MTKALLKAAPCVYLCLLLSGLRELYLHIGYRFGSNITAHFMSIYNIHHYGKMQQLCL